MFEITITVFQQYRICLNYTECSLTTETMAVYNDVCVLREKKIWKLFSFVYLSIRGNYVQF